MNKLQPKELYASVAVQPALVRVPSLDCQSRLSVAYNNGNEVKSQSVHRSLGIYPMAEEISRKPQVGDHLN